MEAVSPVSSPSLAHEKGAKLLQDPEKGHGEHDLRQKQGEQQGLALPAGTGEPELARDGFVGHLPLAIPQCRGGMAVKKS